MPFNQISALFLLVSLTGCVGMWREQSYTEQHAYPFTDTTVFQGDLRATIDFLMTIGLKPMAGTQGGAPMTEMFFIRDVGDHFHENVTLRGLARLDQPGWVITIKVESYALGEEGAINAGQALMKEIDDWERRDQSGPLFRKIPQPTTAQ
jgi:hypothetical protein